MSGRVILNQVVNRYSLGRHLTSFLILNKNLPPKSKKLITVGLEITNIKTRQAGESSALLL